MRLRGYLMETELFALIVLATLQSTSIEMKEKYLLVLKLKSAIDIR